MEINETLSICVPARHHNSYLQELLLSIQKQILQQPSLAERIKIYVFDNESNDGTAELVTRFDLPLVYKKNQKKLNDAEALFQAYELPMGQYIWVIEDQELLFTGGIETIVALLDQFQPALLLNQSTGYENFVQMPSCFNNYQEFALFAEHHNPHMLLQQVFISTNVIRKQSFDITYARKHQQESYASSMGMLSGVKQDNGKVVYNQQQTFTIDQQSGQVNSLMDDVEQTKYLTWVKQMYELQEIVPQRVVADYHLRLHPFVPKVSILINFEVNSDITVDENLQVLNQTIESVLVQDYVHIEVFINSHCSFWPKYMEFAQRTQPYGKTVQYTEIPLNASDEAIKQVLNGEYLLLMNAGECLIDHGYINLAVQIMVANGDTGSVFANYLLQEPLNSVTQKKCGLNVRDRFPEQSSTKINGQGLFFNYDTLWCRPCTTVFRQELFSDNIEKYLIGINKFMFPGMLLGTNSVFYNKMVAICPDDVENGSGKVLLENYYATLEYIDLATINGLMCDFPKTELQKWRDVIVKQYCLAIINKVDTNLELLIGLHSMAKKTGVAHLLHESMSEIVSHLKTINQSRFLLIKAWGCGMWADMNHVLGQLLLAEMLNRTPIVYWGKDSLHYSDDMKNVFGKYFLPVSPYKLTDVMKKDTTYYPAKWDCNTIYEKDMEKYDQEYREIELLNLFDRVEHIIVSDTYVSLDVVVKYLRPEHELYGCDSLQVARWLCKKYIKLQPDVEKIVDDFYWEKIHNNKIIAVYMYAGDEIGDKQTTEERNQYFFSKITNFCKKEPGCTILLLTNTEAILQKFAAICGEKLIYPKRNRKSLRQGGGATEIGVDPSLLVKEFAIDIYLAAKCDYLIGYRSEISNAILRLKEWDMTNVYLFEPEDGIKTN